MKKIEKAVQMEMETLEERIVGKKCPHNYGMKDRAGRDDRFACDSNCEKCWSEEVEGDENE